MVNMAETLWVRILLWSGPGDQRYEDGFQVYSCESCCHFNSHLLILPFPLCSQYDYRKDRERRDDYRGRDRDYDRGSYVF